LAAKRSQRVSTFPGHWAGISGYVENELPLERAVIEVDEECGIDRSELALAGVGEPFLAGNGPQFRVHPFLFIVGPDCEPRIDWEAQRFEWVEVDDLCHERLQPTVPRLAEGLRRVWPAWDWKRAYRRNRELAVRWLHDDRRRGAGGLARAAARHWQSLVRLVPEEEFAECRESLRIAADEFAATRPAMAAPRNMMDDVLGEFESATTKDDLLERIEKLVQAATDAESVAAQRCADALPEGVCVAVISYSGTVREALMRAGDSLDEVLVCEGRPLCEGRSLAASLVESGARVTLITEAQIMLNIDQVHLVLLGADTILESGDVVNKSGSALLALAARECDIPVWVVSTELKRRRRPSDVVPQEEMPTAEVWDDPPPGVITMNQYFEPIPAHWVSQLITELDSSVPDVFRP